MSLMSVVRAPTISDITKGPSPKNPGAGSGLVAFPVA